MKMFIRYVETIIKSERRLTLLREGLRPYRRQVQLILHQITSKKHSSTRMSKIIEQMRLVLNLKVDLVDHLLSELRDTKIGNNFIYSLFVNSDKPQKGSASMKKQELLLQVYEVLYTFCLSKATLKSIARQLYRGVSLVFSELDEHSKHYIDRTDMKLILREVELTFREKDLNILMNHFGSGEDITL